MDGIANSDVALGIMVIYASLTVVVNHAIQ